MASAVQPRVERRDRVEHPATKPRLCPDVLEVQQQPARLEHSWIVRPNLFPQNVPETTIPSINPDGRFYLNAGHARISMVDTRDVAAVAIAALTEPGHETRSTTSPVPKRCPTRDVGLG